MACEYSVSKIADEVADVLKLGIPCFPPIPFPLLALGAKSRRGLNKKKIASDVISQFATYGIPTGENNVFANLTTLIVEKIIDAICYDAKVQVAGAPASLGVIQVNGGNAGGPVVSVGTNISFMSIEGVVV